VSSAREGLTAAGIEEAEDCLVVDPGVAGGDRHTFLKDYLSSATSRDHVEPRSVA
jgi:hypothetical protein